MLFCLSYLFPGKIGARIRSFFIIAFGLVLIYAVCWALTLKELKFNPRSSMMTEDGILNMEIEIQNNAYIGINLLNVDFYNKENEKIEKTSEGLPLYIAGKSSKAFKMFLTFEEFKAVEITVKIMQLTKKFKQDIPSPK